ncbi:ORF MSV246 hypothetical protein [Melanoplus sanguinipes entomopoxvirus]|uniref:Uncharacterized protein n=1 Tax=Melanoplus sanguinipes entomopoxvirus TaxID=83191 RepID=Q9YVJ5_MSEPV|nr:ORF MSV246 hypothetical protein [Melanoplus sanguinipes entomopoxvirus]AAC97723.1 ORF MSV246 hypothetical protein [Melanoplus sanguinipes entomopoxvirus 'O']
MYIKIDINCNKIIEYIAIIFVYNICIKLCTIVNTVAIKNNINVLSGNSYMYSYSFSLYIINIIKYIKL